MTIIATRILFRDEAYDQHLHLRAVDRMRAALSSCAAAATRCLELEKGGIFIIYYMSAIRLLF